MKEPKEYAKELVNYYFNKIGCISLREAKKCALIAIDLVINVAPLFDKSYWEEVKKELKKL
jgi:hypothetical protein